MEFWVIKFLPVATAKLSTKSTRHHYRRTDAILNKKKLRNLFGLKCQNRANILFITNKFYTIYDILDDILQEIKFLLHFKINFLTKLIITIKLNRTIKAII